MKKDMLNRKNVMLIIVLFVVFCLALFIAFSSSHKYDFEDVVKYKGKTYGLLEYNGDIFTYNYNGNEYLEEEKIHVIKHDKWKVVYLDGDLFILEEDEEAVCVAVVVKYDDKTCELKNIATAPQSRGKGYAGKMIKYLFEEYKEKYEMMIVGTTENMIPFYVLNGFNRYHHTVKNFFVDNYEEEIWDGDLHCIDMYYYSKYLNK